MYQELPLIVYFDIVIVYIFFALNSVFDLDTWGPSQYKDVVLPV